MSGIDLVKKRRGHTWPTAEQECLLRATLLDGEAAVEAWRKWRATIRIDAADKGTRRLMPLLYRNLIALGIRDPLLDILKGVYRVTWYKNHTLFREMAGVLMGFGEAGYPTMVLKGAALLLQDYCDFGLRPVGDFDFLIRTEWPEAVVKKMSELGWSPARMARPYDPNLWMSVIHAVHFDHPSGFQADLHTRLFHDSSRAVDDDVFWENAVSVDFHGVATRVLSSTDRLLHSCVHGTSWSPIPTFPWIADAVTILRRWGRDIDWDRLVRTAEKLSLVLPLRSALRYLSDSMDAPIPAAVVLELESHPVTRRDLCAYRIRTSPGGLTRGLPALWLFSKQTGLAAGSSLRIRFLRFPRFLQLVWSLPHLWQVPFYFGYKGLRALCLFVRAVISHPS